MAKKNLKLYQLLKSRWLFLLLLPRLLSHRWLMRLKTLLSKPWTLPKIQLAKLWTLLKIQPAKPWKLLKTQPARPWMLLRTPLPRQLMLPKTPLQKLLKPQKLPLRRSNFLEAVTQKSRRNVGFFVCGLRIRHGIKTRKLWGTSKNPPCPNVRMKR